MLRRRPFSLPHAAHLTELRAVAAGRDGIAPADPAGFAEAIVAHRLTGIAVGAIERGELRLPERSARILRDAHTIGVLTSALARRELPDAAEAIAHAAGAAPVLLKGPAIADRVYGDRAQRPFTDLDLLVDRADLEAAIGALRRSGYEERVELQPGFGATHGHDVHMSKPVGRREVAVEVHWRIGDDDVSSGLTATELRAGGEPMPGAPAAVAADLPDQLLICSVHLLSDRLKRMIWIVDLARIGDRLDEPAWNRAFERANALGLSWVLHRGLDYAEHHLGYERPRPTPPGPPPPFGPLRAVEAIDARASLHIGRLGAMSWPRRPGYIRDVLLPAREGIHVPSGDRSRGRIRVTAGNLARALRSLRRGR